MGEPGVPPRWFPHAYSPGWTRTNNPPVNSRMLCQLSYRGTVLSGPKCSRDGYSEIVAASRSRGLSRAAPAAPSCAVRIGGDELAAASWRSRRRRSSSSAVSSSIPSAAARASSSASSGTSSASGSPGSSRCSRARRCSSASKCSGVELGEQLAQLGVRGDPGERVALEARALLQQPRRDLTRGASGPARREAGLRLLRQVQPVGGEPHRVLPLGRVLLEAREHLAHAEKRLLLVRRAVDLEPDAVAEVALGAGEPLLEALGRVGRIAPRRQRDDAHVEPLRRRELHPSQRRRLAGRVAVEAEVELAASGARAPSAAAR